MMFEKATVDDIPQLFELIETCYRGDIAKTCWTYETDVVGGNRTTEEILKEEMSTPGGSYLKHTNEQGKIVGCVYIKVMPDVKKAYVGYLCVHPMLQSQGIGKSLMTATEDAAKEAGCTIMCMNVLTVRKKLKTWYKKLGYKYTGETIPFPEDCGIPKIPLELELWEKICR